MNNNALTRRETLKKGTAVSGALLLGGTALTGSAAADSDNAPAMEKADLTGETYYNLCTDEMMEVTRGTVNFFFQNFSVGPDGCRYHANGTYSLHGHAVGQDTGQEYRFNEQGRININEDGCEEGPRIARESYYTKYIGLGGAPDLRGKILAIFTVNANGILTVDKIKFSDTVCP